MLISIYLFLIYVCFKDYKFKKPSKNFLFYVLGVFIFFNLCAFIYAKACNFIYYWDNATYWIISRNIATGSLGSNFLTNIYNSIITDDYNVLAGIAPGIIESIFGGSRMCYIFAVTNCFFIPCAIMIRIFSKNTLKAIAITAFLPVLLFLALTGFVDVFGVAICILCFLLAKKSTLKRGFLIGILLAFLILFRRWYAFFGISFLVGMFVKNVVDKKGYLSTICALTNVGMILTLFFMPLVTNKLLTDYSTLYAGYKFSLETDFHLITRYFGVIPLLLYLIASIYCIKKNDYRIIIPVVQIIICFLLFTRTQTHGQQHLLLYVSSIVAILVYSLEKLNKNALIAVLIISIIISANTLVDRPQPQSLSEIKDFALIPNFSMRGRNRDDARVVLEIKNRLDELYSDSKVGVNLSSLEINGDVLRNVQPSLNEKEHDSNYLIELPQVDSRDKDLEQFYNVDYILTSNPPLTHLGEEKQKLVDMAQKCLQNNIAFGKAFKKEEEEYKLGDITLLVYKKVKEVSESEKLEFSNMIND